MVKKNFQFGGGKILEQKLFEFTLYIVHYTLYIVHCTFLLKSWFFGMQQFSFNPAGIFSLKDTLKIFENLQRQKNPQNQQVLGFIIESTL